MSGFGCWIQPRPATILTFLPVFDSTTASILEKFDLSSWKTVSSSPRITANQCFFAVESSAIGDISKPPASLFVLYLCYFRIGNPDDGRVLPAPAGDDESFILHVNGDLVELQLVLRRQRPLTQARRRVALLSPKPP